MSATANLLLLTSAWSVISAIAVGVVGATALRGGSSRPRGALAFGLFGVAWSAQIVSYAIGGLTSGALAQGAYLVGLVCYLLMPYLLIELTAAQLERSTRLSWSLLRWGGAAIALLAALLLLVDPALLTLGVLSADGGTFQQWGPLYVPLVLLPAFLAFGVAIVGLARAKRLAPTSRVADRNSLLLAGLGLYVAFAAANNAAFYGENALAGTPYFGSALLLPTFVALTILVAAAGTRELLAARLATGAGERRRSILLGLALLAPLAWGALEGWLSASSPALSLLETVGLWRLAGVVIIAYGLARWRYYDLPQRATRLTANATGVTAAAASAAAAYGAASVATEGAVVPALAGIVVLLAVLAPSLKLARRIFGVATTGSDASRDESLYGQRIDSYRAALEASLARGTLDEDADFLAALRERFGITAAEERVLMHYARSSVIVPRSTTGSERTPHPFDAYERLRLLGEGGGGRTWLARDRSRERLVVLKEPLDRHQQDAQTREAVLREARLAARIRHANVVSVIEVVEGKQNPIIVMEYLEGGSLADLLRSRGGSIPWPEAIQILDGVLRGLEAVHAAGIAHRDIKPSNVLLTSEGTPKLADFGVAMPLSSGHTIVESSTTFAGTLSYVAPEVLAGTSTGDRRSDVYSAAALLLELVHGVPPGKKGVILVRDVLPPALASALARGLADKPDARFPTARAFAEELQRLAPIA